MSLFALITRQWLPWRQLILNPLGWLLCSSIFLPWYLAEYAVQGQAFVDGFLLKHNLGRFTNTLEGHGGHWYYYLLMSCVVFMPASGMWLELIGRSRQLLKSNFDIWCCCWFVVVLVLFSASKTQLPHYLLYGATPVFILMAKYREHFTRRWLMLLPAVVFIGFFALVPYIAEHLINTSTSGTDNKLIANLRDGLIYFNWRYSLYLLLSLAALVWVGLALPVPVWQRQLLVSVIVTTAFIGTILPTAAAIQQQPLAQAVQFARSIKAPIVMYRQDMPSFSVYLKRVIPIREPRPGEVVFTAVNQLQHFPNARILFSRGALVLAQLDDTAKPLINAAPVTAPESTSELLLPTSTIPTL
jgi:4-amino-4-deoxy-L-arabinose transferase-like glycosyltransferase